MFFTSLSGASPSTTSSLALVLPRGYPDVHGHYYDYMKAGQSIENQNVLVTTFAHPPVKPRFSPKKGVSIRPEGEKTRNIGHGCGSWAHIRHCDVLDVNPHLRAAGIRQLDDALGRATGHESRDIEQRGPYFSAPLASRGNGFEVPASLIPSISSVQLTHPPHGDVGAVRG